MKVGIIARGLTPGGVGRFLRNILREFDRRKDFDFYLIYNQKEFFENENFSRIKKIFIQSENKFKFDYLDSRKKIKELDLDCVIYPKNIIPFTHFGLKCKKYVVVHDLGYFEKKFNAYPFFDTLFMKTFMEQSCKKADLIFAVSEYTKKDIIEKFKISNGKIKVINEGAEKSFSIVDDEKKLNAVTEKFSIKKPFILYSGRSDRKNVWRVMTSFNALKTKIPHTLCLNGRKNKIPKEILRYIEDNLKDRVNLLDFVSEEDLINLYNSADLYLYPSLYEGFGLPILEAQACGCPVLTSNVTSCPEVAGKGALIIDPYSEEELKNGILKMIQNQSFRQKLIKKGFENLNRYSWGKTADKILEGLT